jgi:transcriptional regulator with XRE-family HTH domain
VRIDIGGRLRAERKARRLSQADIERRTGFPRCRISWLENGRAVPTIETLEKISDALEIPLHQLFRDGERPAEGLAASKRAAASKTGRFNRAGQARLLREMRQHLERMREEDQDLLLYIARKLANRVSGGLSFDKAPGAREDSGSAPASVTVGKDL